MAGVGAEAAPEGAAAAEVAVTVAATAAAVSGSDLSGSARRRALGIVVGELAIPAPHHTARFDTAICTSASRQSTRQRRLGGSCFRSTGAFAP
jgi:hypothetical protein